MGEFPDDGTRVDLMSGGVTHSKAHGSIGSSMAMQHRSNKKK